MFFSHGTSYESRNNPEVLDLITPVACYFETSRFDCFNMAVVRTV